MGPNLRLWPALHHLSDDKSRSDIAYLVTYGDKELNDYGTALYITTNGSVYAAGVNSYIGRYSKQTEIIKDGGDFLQGSVEVEALSSLNLKKIVQSSCFGAAMTSSNDVYLWGDPLSKLMLGEKYIVMYECFTPDSVCKKCASRDYSPISVGGFTINKCEACLWCPNYSFESPNTRGSAVKTFVAYCDAVDVLCSSCRQLCSFLCVGDHDLFHCKLCDLLQESIGWFEESSSPVRLRHSLRIVDLECGSRFLLVKTASNDLVVWGSLGCRLQGYVNNPDNVVIRNVSCGSRHLAVITDKGALYTCGFGSSGQLGYEWNNCMGFTTLRRVTLPGSAVKVCCGKSSTACLLVDGSVAYFGRCRDGSPRMLTMKKHTFIDIACATLKDFFSAKTTSSIVFFWGPQSTPELYLKVDARDCLDALAGRSTSYNRASPEISFMNQINPCGQHGFSHYAQFYDRKVHSDLMIKLKDGDFPAHRIVLFNSSVYYKQLLVKSFNDRAVDMTSYDPCTYRNVLKCYYQTLAEELDWRELLDLHNLAISHKEVEIVKYTLEKLRHKLNEENMEELTRVAKSKDLKDLMDVCQSCDLPAEISDTQL